MCGPNVVEDIETEQSKTSIVEAANPVRIFQDRGGFLIVHTGLRALYINPKAVNERVDYSGTIPIAWNVNDPEYFVKNYGGEWISPDDLDIAQEKLAAEFPVDTRVEVVSCGGNVIGLATVTGVGNSTDVEGDAADVVLIRLDKPARFGPDGFYSAYNISAPPHLLRKAAVVAAPDDIPPY